MCPVLFIIHQDQRLHILPLVSILPQPLSLESLKQDMSPTTHLLQQGLSQTPLLLHHNEHLLMHSCCQIQIQLLRAGSHLADEFLMREDTISSQPAVVLNALAPSWQLQTDSKLSVQVSASQEQLFFPPSLTYVLQTYPVCSAKVNSLSKVVALVKPTVVSPGKGYDEFSCTLVCTNNLRKKSKTT